MVDKSNGKFLKVVCSRCRHGQIVFGKSATKVKCFRCNKLLLKTRGGKMRVRTVVREVFP